MYLVKMFTKLDNLEKSMGTNLDEKTTHGFEKYLNQNKLTVCFLFHKLLKLQSYNKSIFFAYPCK